MKDKIKSFLSRMNPITPIKHKLKKAVMGLLAANLAAGAIGGAAGAAGANYLTRNKKKDDE